MEKRLVYFDGVKGLLMLMVILGHAIEISNRGFVWENAVYLYTYTVTMPLFLLIQGHLSHNAAKTDEKIIKRTLFFIALFVLSKLYFYGGLYAVNGSFPSWMQSSFWGEMGAPWYMLTSAFFMAALFFIRKISSRILVPASVIIAVIAGFEPFVGGMFSLMRTVNFLPFFLIGFYLPREIFERCWKIESRFCWACRIGLVALLLLLYVLLKYNTWFYNPTVQLFWGSYNYTSIYAPKLWIVAAARMVAYVVSGSMIVLILLSCAGRPKILEKILNNIGQHTLAIYFFHYPMLVWLNKRLSLFLLNSKLAMMVLVLETILVAFILTLKPFVWPISYLKKSMNFLTNKVLTSDIVKS